MTTPDVNRNVFGDFNDLMSFLGFEVFSLIGFGDVNHPKIV